MLRDSPRGPTPRRQPAEVAKLIWEIDDDGDGLVNWHEFETGMWMNTRQAAARGGGGTHGYAGPLLLCDAHHCWHRHRTRIAVYTPPPHTHHEGFDCRGAQVRESA